METSFKQTTSNKVERYRLFLPQFELLISDEKEEIIPWSQGYDPYEEEIEKESNVRSLVSYYINELKFTYVTNYKILKPNFERTCYTLVQEVDMLQNNREMVWQSHTPDEEMIN